MHVYSSDQNNINIHSKIYWNISIKLYWSWTNSNLETELSPYKFKLKLSFQNFCLILVFGACAVHWHNPKDCLLCSVQFYAYFHCWVYNYFNSSMITIFGNVYYSKVCRMVWHFWLFTVYCSISEFKCLLMLFLHLISFFP